MEAKEKLLIEKILGKKFLDATEEYGKVMKMSFVKRGATLAVAASLGRVAEVAFVKGAERYRSSLWHDYKTTPPKEDTFVLCKGTEEAGNHLFLARLVKSQHEGIMLLGEDGKRINEEVDMYMELPNVEVIRR